MEGARAARCATGSRAAPLFVNCCHRAWCQRETGSAFAINAMIEADRVVLLRASPRTVDDAVGEREGTEGRRCPKCARGAVEQLRGRGRRG